MLLAWITSRNSSRCCFRWAANAAEPRDKRPVIVIDPGHGGIDNGSQASGESEKNLVLGFALALRDRVEKAGKYRVVMTRIDDTFVPLADRVRIARTQSAALFVSIHADALPRGEGDARGATIYTLSDKASDAEAERLRDEYLDQAQRGRAEYQNLRRRSDEALAAALEAVGARESKIAA